MKAVLQRVLSASVECEGRIVSEIEKGFMVLLGVTKTDTNEEADTLASKIAGLRIFEDENGKMNLSISDIQGTLAVISNFTLYLQRIFNILFRLFTKIICAQKFNIIIIFIFCNMSIPINITPQKM